MPPFIDSAEQLDNCPTKSSGYADRDRHFIGDTRHGLKAMTNYMTEYYRCPSRYAQFSIGREMSEASGYFCFDGNTVYGRCSGLQPAKAPTDPLSNADQGVRCENGTLDFPFDLTQVIDNLRFETYLQGSGSADSTLMRLYYLLRPALPVSVRKHLQKIRLRGWEKLPFPSWPVDATVENILNRIMLLSLRSNKAERIPFVWFWPNGASSCALMTHDVETSLGTNLCPMLMDVNDSFGIKASFQVIPEERYQVTPEFLHSIRHRGFEVVVHDLNHDGRLFRDRKGFVERAAKINAYGKKFGAAGFRAGVLYRNQQWYDALDFEYDMSVPNVAHLDPQRGGCCTVMPYFVGQVLELPVTMTQDYTLFNILNDYSTELWERQIELIMEQHGLISVVIHPDYLTGSREKSLYQALLTRLVNLREKRNVWITTPGEVNRWWRDRAKMTIVEDGGGHLRIEGAGSERACIAYASEKDGRLSMDVHGLRAS
jgi:hypothetical protein